MVYPRGKRIHGGTKKGAKCYNARSFANMGYDTLGGLPYPPCHGPALTRVTAGDFEVQGAEPRHRVMPRGVGHGVRAGRRGV